jgi:hypothetical protein
LVSSHNENVRGRAISFLLFFIVHLISLFAPQAIPSVFSTPFNFLNSDPAAAFTTATADNQSPYLQTLGNMLLGVAFPPMQRRPVS